MKALPSAARDPHSGNLLADNHLSVGGTCLDFALLYASLGLRVFPCHSVVDGKCSCGKDCGNDAGKKPWIKNNLNAATTNEQILRAWWRRWHNANVAIVTGNGIVVIDIDPRNGGDKKFAELERELGPLPREWVVKTGGGGLHIFLSVPTHRRVGCRKPWGKDAGIDIKGNGGYVVTAPSNHRSGNLYEWESRVSHVPPPCPAAWLEVLTDGVPFQTGHRLEEGVYASLCPIRRNSWSPDTFKRIRAVIKREAVSIEGFRNDHQLSLVQQLDRIPEIRDCPAAALKKYIAEWYYKSATKTPFDAVWKVFVYQWDEWRNRDYLDPTENAFAAAMSKPLPAAAYKYRSKPIQKLVALCHELQALYADDNGVWYLACRKAADLLGVKFRWANTCLNKLCFDGVIQKAEAHEAGSMWAQRYRYIADDAQPIRAAA